MNDINVMMIGFSGAGKTSYMIALYNRFCSEQVAGFQLRAVDDDEHECFIDLGTDLDMGFYPASTDIHSSYNFNLFYKEEEVLEFNWSDYRGGVLGDKSHETNRVVNDIVSSDALIIFLDSTKFYEEGGKPMVRIMNRIQQLMMQTISKKETDDYFPVSFVFTKLDEVDLVKMRNSAAFRLFMDKVVPLIQQSQDAMGLFTFTIVGEDNYNIEYPFIFTMYMCLRSRLTEYGKLLDACTKRYNHCVAECKRYAESGGVWNEITSFFSGDKSDYDIAMEKANEAKGEMECVERLQAEAEKLEEPVKLLAALLEKCNEDEQVLMKIF